MLENISEEEYNDAQSKLPDLKKELFNVRYAMALTRDANQLKLLEEKVSLEEIAEKVCGDDKILTLVSDLVPEYNCDCSRERII